MKNINQINFESLEVVAPKSKEILGMNVSYRDIGSGDVIFALPSWPATSLEYLPLSIALKDNFRVISLDMPGWGGHSSQMKFNPTTHNYVKIIEEFIKSFNVEKFYLLGYSFGGAVAQIIVDRKELKPEKLILISTIHSGKEIYLKHKRIFDLYKSLRFLPIPNSLIKDVIELIMLEKFSKTVYFKEYHKTALYQAMMDDVLRCNIKTLVDSLCSLFQGDALKHFNKKTKTLVIYGDSDPEYIQKESNEIATLLNEDPIILKNADHNHLFFDVNKSAEVIAEFLAGD